MRRPHRKALFLSSALSGLLLMGLVGPAQSADQTYQFDIPAEPLGQALTDFSKAASQQIVFSEQVTSGKKTAGLHGRYTAPDALKLLLAGTDLVMDENSTGVMAVRSKNVRAAQTEGAATGPGASPETVIVTAQKKEERLEDVPVPVSVLQATTLIENNQTLLQDFYATVPGLTINESGVQDTTAIAIRGITGAGSSSFPTVGVLVDGLPFTSSLARSSGNSIPDIDPGDLSRIEVLRGPQGTLYGASSMGGLINYVTADPDTSAFFGRVQAGVSGVSNGSEPGYDIRGSMNVPVTDTFAFRVSAFDRQDPGYIDNPVLHENGINQHEADGGRIAFKWTPFDFLTWKVSGLYERIQSNGSDDVNVGPGYSDPLLSGGLQQDYPPNVGGYRRIVGNVSSTLIINLDTVTLTSLTGYSIHGIRDSWDFTAEFGSLTCGQFPTSCNASGVGFTPITDRTNASKFSQEFRLTGSLWKSLDYLVGATYTDEHLSYYENILAEAPMGQIVGTWVKWVEPNQDAYDESAVFADLTYHFSDQFDLQVGGRESWLKSAGTDFQISNGVLNGPVGTPAFTAIQAKQWATANKFTFLVSPSYKFSSDDMVYARIASGYRPGQGNGYNLVTHATLPGVGPDSTVNYEVGFKGGLFDNLLFLDASLYYIDWTNIQNSISVNQPGETAILVNSGSAKSEGVEISAEAHPLNGLTLSGWFDYDYAVVNQSLPAGTGYGPAGSRLPLSAQYTGNFSVRQEFPLTNDVQGFAGGTFIYVGDRLGTFTSNAGIARQDYPAYTQINLQAGAIYNSWSFNLYLNNIGDTRGVVGSRLDYTGFQYITPRTIGINIIDNF